MMAKRKILPVIRLGMDTSVKTEVFPPTGDFNMIYHCTGTLHKYIGPNCKMYLYKL